MKNLDICFRKEKHRKLVYDILKAAFDSIKSCDLKPLTCTEFIDCFLANKQFCTEKKELFKKQLDALNNTKGFRFIFQKPEYNTFTCKLPYELKKYMYEFERTSFFMSCTIEKGKYGVAVLRINFHAETGKTTDNSIDFSKIEISKPDIYDDLAY